MQGNLNAALETLNSVKDINTFDYWLELGQLYWEMENYEGSLVPYLKATKLNPNSYLCFLHLGNYYKKYGDLDKARRCYEKAFRLNSNCQAAGLELSQIYRQQKNWVGIVAMLDITINVYTAFIYKCLFQESNFALLQNLIKSKIDINNKWAYLQLGLHYYEQKEYSKSIDVLRLLVRYEPSNL